MNNQITKQELIQKMSECEQTKGQSVLEHGISVKNYLKILNNKKPSYQRVFINIIMVF